ncbi:MAG: NUDIX hydrolase N-terminal domain-containing protein [Clostridiales bacterium]|jgi:ADP-ribose pyrophosphatase YjhB (NUDIX family)|nr:NUDIX hydrolase N-terminal domain-containing protein [Clostridiales bacterium]
MELIEISHELMAIANDSLLYCKDRFDIERFKQIRTIAAKLMEMSVDGISKEQAQEIFEENDGYQTPKIDTRAAIFNDKEQVLLVKDYDGKWAMPGGWCEYNTTIMENTVKEAREEAGLVVEPVRLVAAHSNRKHNNPKSFFYITRFFVLCNVTGGEFKPNEETTDARYFDVDSLPSDLNDHKSSPEQIRLCLEALRAKSWEPVID